MAFNTSVQMQSLWMDFIEENPDYGPRGKLNIDRKAFYSWLRAYAVYATGLEPEEGRNKNGMYIMFNKEETTYAENLN